MSSHGIARGRVGSSRTPVPMKKARLAPDVAIAIESSSAARPGLRGATRMAPMPAATAPIVAVWNAHRMSSPPEPSTSITAMAPSAQAFDASARTIT